MSFIAGRKKAFIFFSALMVVSALAVPAIARHPICDHGKPPGPEETFNNLKPLVEVDTGLRVERRRDGSAQTLKDFSLRQKILVLAATEDSLGEPSLPLAIRALRSFGIPYEVRILTRNGRPTSPGSLRLESTNGGLYSGIVFTTAQLAYFDVAGRWVTALDREQWQELEAYEEKYDVRRVSLYSSPIAELGLETALPADGSAITMSFDGVNSAHVTGLKADAKFPLELAWHYPARIVDPLLAKAVMRFDALSGGEKTVAAAEVNRRGRVAELHFFFAQSELSPTSLALNNFWIQWMTRGTYIGLRRVLLGVHVDDLFLISDLWNPATESNPENETRVYRMTRDDLNETEDWQGALSRALPPTSDVRIEFAFNGEGVADAGGDQRDDLFRSSMANRDHFFWVNHTYTHADLNPASFESASEEVRANINFASRLLGTGLVNFSSRTIVTPQISGLFNRNALNAFGVFGIVNVVGDSTRPELKPTHEYRGRLTTESENGVAGLLIIPRNATEIYYDASIPEELTSEYNFRYRSYWGRNLTLAEILSKEASRVGRQLISYQPSPHMLHQANLRIDRNLRGELSGRSRMSLGAVWAEAVLKEYLRFGTLPVRSLRTDQLAEEFRRRMDFEDCGFNGVMDVRGGKVVSLVGTSTANCRVALTGVTLAQIDASQTQGFVSSEVYGSDSTLWFNQAPARGLKVLFR